MTTTIFHVLIQYGEGKMKSIIALTTPQLVKNLADALGKPQLRAEIIAELTDFLNDPRDWAGQHFDFYTRPHDVYVLHFDDARTIIEIDKGEAPAQVDVNQTAMCVLKLLSARKQFNEQPIKDYIVAPGKYDHIGYLELTDSEEPDTWCVCAELINGDKIILTTCYTEELADSLKNLLHVVSNLYADPSQDKITTNQNIISSPVKS